MIQFITIQRQYGFRFDTSCRSQNRTVYHFGQNVIGTFLSVDIVPLLSGSTGNIAEAVDDKIYIYLRKHETQ